MDDIVMRLGHLEVDYGFDTDGESVVSVSWVDPDTGRVADKVIRNGIISFLQESEAAEAFDEWDD